jgi:plasmid stabilization system protein ParE
MTYSISFISQAQQDIIDSIAWYNSEKENLGLEFYERLKFHFTLLTKNPLHYSLRNKTFRVAKIRRFPYLIYFKVEQSKRSLVVLAVLHTSRNPNIIKNRK